MKAFRISIILVLVLSLLSCSLVTDTSTFTPTGEIYTKTSPSKGDGGVDTVVDITIEKVSYPADGEITVPVQIGVGHQKYGPAANGRVVATLEIKIWMNTEVSDVPTDTKCFAYSDWGSDKYISTEPGEKPWYLIWLPVYYASFYPLYHETFMLEIPAEVDVGYLSARVIENTDTGNTFNGETICVRFKRTDGNLVFSVY